MMSCAVKGNEVKVEGGMFEGCFCSSSNGFGGGILLRLLNENPDFLISSSFGINTAKWGRDIFVLSPNLEKTAKSENITCVTDSLDSVEQVRGYDNGDTSLAIPLCIYLLPTPEEVYVSNTEASDHSHCGIVQFPCLTLKHSIKRQTGPKKVIVSGMIQMSDELAFAEQKHEIRENDDQSGWTVSDVGSTSNSAMITASNETELLTIIFSLSSSLPLHSIFNISSSSSLLLPLLLSLFLHIAPPIIILLFLLLLLLLLLHLFFFFFFYYFFFSFYHPIFFFFFQALFSSHSPSPPLPPPYPNSSSSSSSSSSTSNFSSFSASSHAEVLSKTQTLSCSPLKLMQYIYPINFSSLPRVPLQPSFVPTRWNSSVLSSSASVNRFSSASASFSTSKKRSVQTQTQQTFDDVRLVVQTRKILPTAQNANSVGNASSNSTSSSQTSSASNTQLQSPRQPNKTLIPVSTTPTRITIQTVNEYSFTPTGKGGEDIQLQSANSAFSVISTNKTKGSTNLTLATQSTQMPLGNLASSSSSSPSSSSSSSASSISTSPSLTVSTFASVSATSPIFPAPAITLTTTSMARIHSSTAHRFEISTSNTSFSTTFALATLRSFFDDTSYSVSASLLAPAIVLGGSSTASIASSSSSSSSSSHLYLPLLLLPWPL
ncbi:uncharacterized protein MONOS_15643 [Monocercomonoides exilis]|uniref:uncharacterized protein n=1 Tax=Monocercomonoides exilis TaxID=2049356 RepID=UPI00355A8848|nr:hypothetical protein MONOS_15643 [Monocercomonoides exilis]